MKAKIVSKSLEVSGRTLSFEHGRFAEAATSAVVAHYGDSVVFASVVIGREDLSKDYFPLSVDEAKKCIDEGKTRLDFYDASCQVINKIKLKDEGNYDEKGIVDSADITAIKSDPATFWTYVQNDLTQLNNYIQKMVGNWGE